MDGMSRHYSNEHSSAEVVRNASLPEDLSEILEVVRVWTEPEHRNQGSASALMMEITRDADKSATVLLLKPAPFGRVGVLDLVGWYGRFGFVVIQNKPVLMARQPQSRVIARGQFATLEMH